MIEILYSLVDIFCHGPAVGLGMFFLMWAGFQGEIKT